MLLKEAMHGYMMDGQIARHSPGSLTLKRQRLGYFIEWCETQGITEVEAVRPNTVRAFLVHLHKTKARNRRVAAPKSLAPETIAGYMRVVRAFFHWCEKEELIQKGHEPTARVPHIKIPEDIIPSFTAEQMDAMLRQCDRLTARGYRDYTILLVLMDTGIRARELVGLNLADMHEDHLVIRGKGEKTREVGLGPTAAKALWKYIHQHRKAASEHEQHVFLSRDARVDHAQFSPVERLKLGRQSAKREGK
jgi:integrase/recombinase XerD